MADFEPFAGLASEASLEELQAIERRMQTLVAQAQRLSFDSTSQLRVLVASLPTLGTLQTGNVGIGDCGKPATAILVSQQAFQQGVGAQFIRS